jgi:sulfide:quinone oxidoreductase
MTTSVVVFGAGFGGLELSTRLSEELGDQVEITLIDRADSFVFGFSRPACSPRARPAWSPTT